MTSREIYAAYVQERRALPIPGYTLEVLPDLSRYTATTSTGEGFVMFADLPTRYETARIEEQIAHFAQIGQPFEWKVYELDSPATLKRTLEARGFASGPEEAFLAFPVANWTAPAPSVERVRVERVIDARGIEDVIAVQDVVWGPDSERLRERLTRALNADAASIFCAYLDDLPAGTGWLDFTPGCAFADLHGGSVLPEARGRGLFSALLHHRIADAKARGYAFLAVDAAPLSRPILLRKGFQHVCMTYPMHRKIS